MNRQNTHPRAARAIQHTTAIRAQPLHEALGFRRGQFAGLLYPLVLVDHLTMTAPTLGPPSPRRDLRRVGLFEDSEGRFHNRDSLGHELDPEGRAVALWSRDAAALPLDGSPGPQVVLLHGAPVREPFVQQGPFVMSHRDALKKVAAGHGAGGLGSLD